MNQNRQFESWDYHVLEVKRVTKVIAGGKRFKIRAFVVIGNRSGLVGFGVGKGSDLSQAVEKAKRLGQKNAVKIEIVGGTISRPVLAKVKASQVLIKPAAAGRGLIAGGTMREILELAGVENATAKIISSSKNHFTNALATLAALAKLSRGAELNINVN